jgi:hypothetical protein
MEAIERGEGANRSGRELEAVRARGKKEERWLSASSGSVEKGSPELYKYPSPKSTGTEANGLRRRLPRIARGWDDRTRG